MKRILAALFFAALFAVPAQAQYFGRNKPRYQQQDFKVSETAHFEIYDYLENPALLQELSTAAELWYAMHQSVLRDTFTQKNPLIIYNDHAGFQQTTAIMGDISVGTGGVTEGLRNRVVFPIAMTNQQTHHVLGHEMVHAFQYHLILSGDSTDIRNMANLPLWMVEGLAEYLSIGRIDAHTALWMRDAVINDKLPRIRDLDSGRYFPYRWGQSFWAFVVGVYGDQAIQPLFVNTAKYGLEPAVRLTLGTTTDSLSSAWQETLRRHYGAWVQKGQKDDPPGKKVLSDDNAGRMNICPVLSPNGRYVIFLSEKNLFTTDLFLADARTGKILKKVASTAQDGHVDQFNFIESAGTWSPDSKKFAFDAYAKGRSTLIVKDVLKGKTLEKITIPGVPAFSNPAWSPDGKTIVVSGLVNGQVDLYEYTLRTKKVRRLTNDRYAEILPSWNASGTLLAFSTDQLSLERGRSNGAWQLNLAVLDMAGGEVENIDVFPAADNLNPHFDKNGNLFFLSNRDGFRNLYEYDVTTKKVFQLTKLRTGITGITPYAPALTVAEDRDRILYTHYDNSEYIIYSAREQDFQPEEVASGNVDMTAAALPPFNPRQKDLVNTNLRLMDSNRDTVSAFPVPKKFKSKFQLDYLGGSTGVGVATGNSSFGAATGLAGGIDMLFSDILGHQQLYTGLVVNGEVTDAAGQFSYINQKRQINWGVNLSHIPIRSQSYQPDPDLFPGIETTLRGDSFLGYTDRLYIQRLFQERVGVFAFYPLSVTRRFELGSSFEFYHQRVDEYRYYYDANGFPFATERQRIPIGSESLRIPSINAAYVGDNSYFGLTAPLQGYRYRIGLERFFGDYNFTGVLLDGRKYFYAKPFTLAVRGLSYLRFGGNANNTDQVFPLFAGQPNFIRGYLSFFNNNFIEQNPQYLEIMAGSKLAVGNVELRLPLTGPKGMALLPISFLPMDLNFFFDAGMGWFTADDLKKADPTPDDGNPHVYHKPLLSAGFSLRINLFGALVVEPFWAAPLSLDKEQRKLSFGLNLLPGW
jgi:Tol biopolymer transport system component